MHQLSGLDNSFLRMETPSQHGHISSYVEFDVSGLEPGGLYKALRKTVEERLHLCGPFRQRLAPVPLEIDRPYWIEDAEFDLDFHLRHIAVPPPGDRSQQKALVARLHSRPLDRSRPLWEYYVIDGLPDDRAAIYTKIHHATIDGVSGSQMWENLLDSSPDGDAIEAPRKRWVPDRKPAQVEMLARGLAGAATNPARIGRMIARSGRSVWESNAMLGTVAQRIGADRIPGARWYLRRRGAEVDADPIPQTPAPHTPWNRTITPHRRVTFFTHPLAEYKRIKNAFGTTLNDVIMAVTASGLRRYLEAHSALPEDPLKAVVPVSVRSESQDDFTNRITQIIADLATNEKDPVERLRKINQSMMSAKRMQQAIPATLLQDWTDFAMPLLGQAHRIIARTPIIDRMNPPFNISISNVPGSRVPLYLGGAKMETMYPLSAIGDSQGLCVTVVSYRDSLDWGFVACRELMPDLDRLEDDFQDSLDELTAAADLAD